MICQLLSNSVPDLLRLLVFRLSLLALLHGLSISALCYSLEMSVKMLIHFDYGI